MVAKFLNPEAVDADMTGEDNSLNDEKIDDEIAPEGHETAAKQHTSVIHPDNTNEDAAIPLRCSGDDDLPQNAREELSTDELQAIVDNLTE